MNPVIVCLLAFFSGAIYELCCVWWVHYSEQGKPIQTGIWSMVAATCQVLGIGQSVIHLYAAPFFVLGYGAGSYLGVIWAKHQKKDQ